MANNLQNFLTPAQAQMGNQNNYPTLPNAFSTGQQVTQFFPQPIGNVYNLSAAAEINNVPVGQGLSVGISLSDGIMYIKSFQNGSPMVLGYKLAPLEGTADKKEEPQINISEVLNDYNQRFERIDNYLKKINERLGGKFEWQV